MRRRVAVVVAILGVVAILSRAAGWLRAHGRAVAHVPRAAPGGHAMGVDVSHHQGAIDWGRVAATGVRFAYIKATEGRDLRDERFDDNWAGATHAGLRVGAYHYFTLCSPGAAQAAHFLAVVPDAPGTLPPAIDLEYEGNCSRRPTQPELERELVAFDEALEERYGRPPIIYATFAFRRDYLADVPWKDPQLWIRDVSHLLPREPDVPWTLWQYDARGDVDGIDGPVDLSVLSGPPAELDRFTR
jgi:lysozyme